MKLTEYQQSAARKILVYGPPKSGKTDLVGQLAENYKLHWFDFEDGIKTLLHSPRMKKEWFENIELYSISDTQTLPLAVDTILRVVKGGPVKICQLHGASNCMHCTKSGAPFNPTIDVSTFTDNDILVGDSVSQLANSAMNHILRAAIQKAETSGWEVKAEWDDYRKQGYIMSRIFSIVQHAPYHSVWISHEQLVDMEEPGKKKLVPIGGTSEFSKTFAKYFDDVVYCDIVNKKHKVASSTTYSGNIVLGSRSGKELEKLETPSLLELFT